jgi:hypothetical protein
MHHYRVAAIQHGCSGLVFFVPLFTFGLSPFMHKLSYVIGLLQDAMRKHGDIAFTVEGAAPLEDLDCEGSILLHEITSMDYHPDKEGDFLIMVMKKHGFAPGAQAR